jgi:hypothetical protein
MNIFLESHKNLLEKLIKADVEFLIIGGYAVNYYGYNRNTYANCFSIFAIISVISGKTFQQVCNFWHI